MLDRYTIVSIDFLAPSLQYYGLILLHTKAIRAVSQRIFQVWTRLDCVLLQQMIEKNFSFHIKDALTNTGWWSQSK